MKKLSIPFCLLAALILTSCSAPQDNSLTDADMEYFQNFWPHIQEAWNNGDREPYIKGHEQSLFMVPHAQTLSTPADIRAFVEGYPELKTSFSDFDIHGNQDFVGVRGNFSANSMEGELMDKGKFIALFKKAESGDWVMTHAIWNSDLPMPAQEAPAEDEVSED